MILEYITGLLNSFNIADMLQRLNLNGFDSKGWITKIGVDNAQILVLKIICFYYLFLNQLVIQWSWLFLRFCTEKKKILQVLSLFNSQEDLNCFFQSVALVSKFSFVNQIKLSMSYNFVYSQMLNIRVFRRQRDRGIQG